jgi:hypothetical protein
VKASTIISWVGVITSNLLAALLFYYYGPFAGLLYILALMVVYCLVMSESLKSRGK